MAISRARLRRLNASLREVLAETVGRELSDPRLGMLTITAVEASADLRHAKVYVTVLEPSRREASLDALESARGVLQSRVARELRTKHTPQLQFLYDEHQDRARRLTALIEEVAPDEPPAAPAAGDPGPGEGGAEA